MPQMPRAQALQCAAFLKALRRTGNVTLAAEQAGANRNTLASRRKRYPDFAQQWDAALAFAQARLGGGGGTTVPAGEGEAAITRGGEFTVQRGKNRAIQVRRANPGRLTAAGERAFLATLAATANVRLAAAATGIGWSAIYHRRKTRAIFEREMKAALAEGYDRIELALLENAIQSLEPDGTDLAEWRDQAGAQPEPLARMTFAQALILLGHHRKTVRFGRLHQSEKPATREETNAVLHRAIRAAEKRMARDG